MTLLANERYDLWLPNSRGNDISKSHIFLDYEEDEFWKFSLDKLALIDLPAVMDLIYKETGHYDLHFVGRGSGGSIAIAMASLLPSNYGQRLRSLISWAPFVYVGNTTTILRFTTYFRPLLMRPDKYNYHKPLTDLINTICVL